MNNKKNIGDTIMLEIISPQRSKRAKKVKKGYGFIINKNTMSVPSFEAENCEIFILKAGEQRNFITHAYSDSSSLFSSKIILIEKFNQKRQWRFKYEEDALIKDITDTIRL
jgi:hypothetical protein